MIDPAETVNDGLADIESQVRAIGELGLGATDTLHPQLPDDFVELAEIPQTLEAPAQATDLEPGDAVVIYGATPEAAASRREDLDADLSQRGIPDAAAMAGTGVTPQDAIAATESARGLMAMLWALVRGAGSSGNEDKAGDHRKHKD